MDLPDKPGADAAGAARDERQQATRHGQRRARRSLSRRWLNRVTFLA